MAESSHVSDFLRLSGHQPQAGASGRGAFFALLLLSVVALAIATLVDRQVSALLERHALPHLMDIMGRSLFRGDAPGTNDLVIVLLAAMTMIYLWPGQRRKYPRLAAWRPQAGFILAAALVIALFGVHGMKFIIGRARPWAVFRDHLPYSPWFVFGPLFISDNASFPSGHTALTFILMAAAYALAGDPTQSGVIKRIGWLWGALALGAGLVMGAARCMSSSHWLTDVLGSIFFGWLIMHLLFFNILHVPEQRRFQVVQGSPANLPPAWELVVSAYILMVILGFMVILIPIHGLLLGKPLWLILLMPPGLAFIWLGATWWRALNQRIVGNLRIALPDSGRTVLSDRVYPKR